MDTLLIILLIVVLLLVQGFFSGSEIALVHADRLRLHHRAGQGHKGAALVLEMFHKPEVLLGTTLVGTNISVVAATTLGTLLMIRFFGEWGDLYAVLLFTPIFLIFGEVVPKSVYQQKADVLAPVVVYPLRFGSWILYPIVFVFSHIAHFVTRLTTGVKSERRNLFVTREQVRTVVEMAEQGADVDVFDRDRIMRVVRFADRTVGQDMVPVAEMVTIGHGQTTRQAIHLARDKGLFRLPVYREERTQIIGILAFTLWDLMDPKVAERPLSEFIKPAFFVSPHELLDHLLPELQRREDHMAIVVDEFGSAIGMITMDDILEEVVGEVVDVGYHFEAFVPRPKYHIEQTEDGAYLMDGRVPLSEASEVLGISLPSGEAHTVGGMVIAHLRRIPAEGESIVLSGYRFAVHEANERRIVRLRIERPA